MRWPAGIIEKIFHDASDVQADDYPPTDQEVAVNAMYGETRSLARGAGGICEPRCGGFQ